MELLKIKKALKQIKNNKIKEAKTRATGAKRYTRRGEWTLCEKEGKENGGEWLHFALTDREEKKATTKKEYKKLLIDKITKEAEKEHAEALARVEKAESVQGFPDTLKIAINWHTNRTWGNNPRAELWAVGYGYKQGRSVGGCGYDKRSTAAAEVLEALPELQALAFYQLNKKAQAFVTRAMNYADIRAVFGYGLHFSSSGRVHFGAGCGMSSVLEELKALGYSVTFQHEPNEGADLYQLELTAKTKREAGRLFAGV